MDEADKDGYKLGTEYGLLIWHMECGMAYGIGQRTFPSKAFHLLIGIPQQQLEALST